MSSQNSKINNYYEKLIRGENIVLRLILAILIIKLAWKMFYNSFSWKNQRGRWYTWLNGVSDDDDDSIKYGTITDSKNKFDINVLGYYYNDYLLYRLHNLLYQGCGQDILKYDWCTEYVTQLWLGYATGNISNPRSFCTTLLPHPSEQKLTTTWKSPLYTYIHNNLNRGVWPTSSQDWINMLCEWGNIEIQNSHVADPSNPNDKNLPKSYKVVPNKYNSYSWETHPDNFLYQNWQIPWNSLLVKGFLTNWTENDDDSTPLYPSAMNPLLGISTLGGVGGWVGFVKSFDAAGNLGMNFINRYVWANDIVDGVQAYNQEKNKKDTSCPNAMDQTNSLISNVTNGAMCGAVGGGIGAIAGGGLGLIWGMVQLGFNKKPGC